MARNIDLGETRVEPATPTPEPSPPVTYPRGERPIWDVLGTHDYITTTTYIDDDTLNGIADQILSLTGIVGLGESPFRSKISADVIMVFGVSLGPDNVLLMDYMPYVDQTGYSSLTGYSPVRRTPRTIPAITLIDEYERVHRQVRTVTEWVPADQSPSDDAARPDGDASMRFASGESIRVAPGILNTISISNAGLASTALSPPEDARSPRDRLVRALQNARRD